MSDFKKPLGYVAGPYTKGDPGVNIHFHCKVFDRLLSDGVVLPYMPLWCHFQHVMFPRHYDDWVSFDNDMIRALPLRWLLRLNASHSDWYEESESSGADSEVVLFREFHPDGSVVIQKSGELVVETIERLYDDLEILRCTSKS